MNELKINGVYRHFKGDYYLVCDVAIHIAKIEMNMLYIGLCMGIMAYTLDQKICF